MAFQPLTLNEMTRTLTKSTEADYIETLINPQYHSGNIVMRHIGEDEQQEIIAHFLANGSTSTYAKYRIGKPRLKNILAKYEVTWEESLRAKPLPSTAPLQLRLDKMLGKVFEYMTFPRQVTGYAICEEFVRIQTTLVKTGAQREVRYKLKEVAKIEREFRPYRDVPLSCG